MANEAYKMELDGVQIGVTDLQEAERCYTQLLGVFPSRQAGGLRRFQLSIGAVELIAAPSPLQSIRLVCRTAEPLPAGDVINGIDVVFSRAGTEPTPVPGSPVLAIDHIVIHSPDPERAISLWRDRFGLRLALDRQFPERGLRLVFFRSGGITLEIASPLPQPIDGGADNFYGVTYRVADLATWCRKLTAAGFDVSPTRPGHKAGTTVATVRSGTAGIPTLLLQDPSRRDEE